ncbi:TetR/AcrR family transcriptional regulator [Ideonella sp.]|uniref:TetR/AcrR family transcriptional regulator n=1 Tax=Ideonella sp. TaxID=1929293 RepID=UPI002B47D166|nr:TetR/AcrR family transcriptional regulator [Ideonella sp.]HJV68618.1 TetR/AcrR family transcriptional regulator [Ideonella sp.]
MASRRDIPPTADTYHHGALREALIAAAETLLREQGLEAFTLRECARRAGVSHAAPAHHFGDARGLLSACAAAGLARLADTMDGYLSLAPAGDATARLRAVGQAYIDFALTNRALFQLMFRRDRLDPQDAALRAAGQRVGDALRDSIDALLAERRLPAAERGQRILLAWSLVHGYVTLVLEQQTGELFGLAADAADSGAAASAMGAELLRLLIDGLARPVAAPGSA